MRSYAVVIPTHDRPGAARFLPQAVDSVLGQTLPAAEVIVVSDGAAETARRVLAGRPVTILEQPKGRTGQARQAGVAAATSDWVCFLDDDDVWHPDFLRTTNEFLASRDDAAAVNASFWTFGADSRYGADLVTKNLAECLVAAERTSQGCDTSYMEIHGRSFELLLERQRGAMSTAVVRRDIIAKIGGFPVHFPYVEDWLFFVNVARFVEWHYIPERLAFIRQHAANITKTKPDLGVVHLQAIHQMWAERSLPTPAHRPLRAYGRDYRFRVQSAIWGALHHGQLDLARRALALGMPLLPSWADRMYALAPPQLTWRIDHMGATIIPGVRRYGRYRDADRSANCCGGGESCS